MQRYVGSVLRLQSNNFRVSQEDALLIPTGPRRLMSDASFMDQSKNLEENNRIIPVENHNPKRRASFFGQNSVDEGHTRILDAVKEKITRVKTSGKRRDSIAAIFSLNMPPQNEKFWSGSFTGYVFKMEF